MQGGSPQPGRSNYLDFELEIDEGGGREYTVGLLRSPAGDARATIHFPFDELALENRLLNLQDVLLRTGGKHRRVLTREEQAVQEFGQALSDTLLSGEIRSYYDMSLREAARQDRGLRLKLRIRPPELNALPSEFLCAYAGRNRYVSRGSRVWAVGGHGKKGATHLLVWRGVLSRFCCSSHELASCLF